MLGTILGENILHVDYDSFKESSKPSAGMCCMRDSSILLHAHVGGRPGWGSLWERGCWC